MSASTEAGATLFELYGFGGRAIAMGGAAEASEGHYFAAFYNPARVRWFYAGAWSFVFFLKHSKEAAAHPQWSKLLQTYFDGVKAGYQAQLAKLGEQPDLGQKQMAGVLARKAALQQVMAGLDVPALESAWKKWVVDMKDPWPSKRTKPK